MLDSFSVSKLVSSGGFCLHWSNDNCSVSDKIGLGKVIVSPKVKTHILLELFKCQELGRPFLFSDDSQGDCIETCSCISAPKVKIPYPPAQGNGIKVTLLQFSGNDCFHFILTAKLQIYSWGKPKRNLLLTEIFATSSPGSRAVITCLHLYNLVAWKN